MARLILGHTTHNSIKVWTRGSARWPVAFIDVLDSAKRRTGDTHILSLDAEDFYTGVTTWEGLSSGREYYAKVAFGKSEDDPVDRRIRDAYTEGKFTTFVDPNKNAKFTFLLGSCNLHSLGIVKNPDKVWTRISNIATLNEAKFMIHCGDQIYADIPFPPTANPNHYRDKYLDAWGDCRSMQKFLTELPHYMILDDHEIINDFHRDMSSNYTDYESLRRIAMKVYYEFQHKHNPDTPETPRQYFYTFNYGDVQFFTLDTRYSREKHLKQIIDENQMQIFKEWLLEYRDNIKFVITSVPFVTQVKRPQEDKWCDPLYAQQRHEIIDHIAENSIEKVVFLAGDMHHSYHAKMSLRKNNHNIDIHELMSSPVNQFTPNITMEYLYHSPFKSQTETGVSFQSKIMPNKFYGNHSNVMAIEVGADAQIKYRVYRTRRNEPSAMRGSFRL